MRTQEFNQFRRRRRRTRICMFSCKGAKFKTTKLNNKTYCKWHSGNVSSALVNEKNLHLKYPFDNKLKQIGFESVSINLKCENHCLKKTSTKIAFEKTSKITTGKWFNGINHQLLVIVLLSICLCLSNNTSSSSSSSIFKVATAVHLPVFASISPIQTNEQATINNNDDEFRTSRSRRRTAFGLIDELNDNEVAVQTKQGIFKGLLLSSNWWHLATNTLNKRITQIKQHKGRLASDKISNDDSNVVGFFGIRYASAPVKRLRFMPPTAYHYASNQIHNMQQLGPICRQRLPVDSATNYQQQLPATTQQQQQQQQQQQSNSGLEIPTNYSSVRATAANNSNWNLHMLLIRRMMPKESFAYLRPLFKRLASLEQSEDCLNLNVYSPIEAIAKVTTGTLQSNGNFTQREKSIGDNTEDNNNNNSSRNSNTTPVLVIIHGESFDYGAGSTINGFRFAKQNRILVVTFNYRLNLLGFPPKLAGASRGNLGLMDQVAALHWIKDNIGSFGGASNNITLLGTKKGAIFVNLLMLSPLAKGLFQRAIMEDGSALSPLVASHIATASSSLSLISQQQQQQAAIQPAAQYLRLLAKLCDCPIYHQRPKNSSSTLSLLTTSTIESVQQQQQQQQFSMSFVDETKTNALTFECLRHKPIEQIMQRVPIDLLQLDQVTGELSIASRWLNSIRLVASEIGSSGSQQQQQQQQQQQHEHLSLAATAAADLTATLDSGSINRLIALVTREQLEREQQQQQTNAKEMDYLVRESTTSVRYEELFNAIYGQPSASIRPLFGPVIDGTIVPDEDIATNMLKQGSSFAQRDLLIGVSRPTLSAPSPVPIYTANQSSSSTLEEAMTNSEIQPPSFELGPDHPMADRINKQMEQIGLTSEQAIDLVNVFVRSFYRYHNQEITNSIINHYLGGHQNARTSSSSGSSSSSSSSSSATSNKNKSLRNNHHRDQIDETKLKINQQQLIILDSLLEAFQDALTNVPILKTALIHATRQLDSLVDAFVGKQFEKWRLQNGHNNNNNNHKQFDHHHSNGSIFQLPITDSTLNFEQNQLIESFTSFAQSLFNDSNWPLELNSPSDSSVLQQPKGTYLYQFNSNLLAKEIEKSIFKVNNYRNSNNNLRSSFGWKSLNEISSGLLMRIHSSQFRNKLGFGCAFDSNIDDELLQLDEQQFFGDTNNNDGELWLDSFESGNQLIWLRYTDWLCTRLSYTLADFVTTGNVNSNNNLQFKQFRSKIQSNSLLAERISRFDLNCFNIETRQQQQKKNSIDDHHSVQVDSGDKFIAENEQQLMMDQQQFNLSTNTNEEVARNCKRELNSIAFDYLIGLESFDEDIDDKMKSFASTGFNWIGFNLFTQQIATLPISLKVEKSIWQVNQVIDNQATFDQQSTFSARNSFWSNFIPALNCTRTQPIIPSSLITTQTNSLASVSNSSLLNLNLLFSCQQGAKSALTVIESLPNNIGQQLQAKINNWKLSNRLNEVVQNHHSLRMANMSQSNSVLEENLDQQQQQQQQQLEIPSVDEQNKNSNISQELATEAKVGKVVGSSDDQQQRINLAMRTKYIGIILVIFGLIISLSLATGACAVIRQRQNKQQVKQKRKKSSSSSSLSNALPGTTHQQSDLQISTELTTNDIQPNCQQLLAAGNVTSVEDCDQDEMMQSSSFILNQNILVPNLNFNQSMTDERRASASSLLTVVGRDSSNQQNVSGQKQILDSNNNNNEEENGRQYVYWNQQQQQVGGNQFELSGASTVTLCQSHSSLNASNEHSATSGCSTKLFHQTPQVSQSLATEHHHHHHHHHPQQLMGLTNTHQTQEPIMMPLISSPLVGLIQHEQQRSTHPLIIQHQSNGIYNKNNQNDYDYHNHLQSNSSITANGGHYGGSSNETQAQSSSVGFHSSATTMNAASTGTTKKRVKISDPAILCETTTTDHRRGEGGAKQQFTTRLNKSGSQQRLDNNHYCPIHRNHSHQSLALDNVAGNYVAINGNGIRDDDTNQFLTAADLWEGVQTIDLLDQRLASITSSSNCDQFSSSTTNSQGLIGNAECLNITASDGNQQTPQYYHYALSHNLDSLSGLMADNNSVMDNNNYLARNVNLTNKVDYNRTLN